MTAHPSLWPDTCSRESVVKTWAGVGTMLAVIGRRPCPASSWPANVSARRRSVNGRTAAIPSRPSPAPSVRRAANPDLLRCHEHRHRTQRILGFQFTDRRHQRPVRLHSELCLALWHSDLPPGP